MRNVLNNWNNWNLWFPSHTNTQTRMASKYKIINHCWSQYSITNNINELQRRKYKNIEYIVKHITSAPVQGLNYKKLDLEPLQITIVSDWSFSENDVRSSQDGYVVFLTNKYNKIKLIDCSNRKSRLARKAVIWVETFALVNACNAVILCIRV